MINGILVNPRSCWDGVNTGGPYHLHGKPGNSGLKVKWYTPCIPFGTFQLFVLLALGKDTALNIYTEKFPRMDLVNGKRQGYNIVNLLSFIMTMVHRTIFGLCREITSKKHVSPAFAIWS